MLPTFYNRAVFVYCFLKGQFDLLGNLIYSYGTKPYTINEMKTKDLKCAKKDIKIENLNIRISYIEQVKQYKYLGSILNDINSIEEEFKERISLDIKA